MLRSLLVVAGWLAYVSSIVADEPDWRVLLQQPILAPGTSLQQVQDYCERRVPRMLSPQTAAEWDAIASDLRARTLRDVAASGSAGSQQ